MSLDVANTEADVGVFALQATSPLECKGVTAVKNPQISLLPIVRDYFQFDPILCDQSRLPHMVMKGDN